MSNYNKTFIPALKALSVSKEWAEMVEEWVLDDILEEEEDYDECLCGHPIKNLYILQNKHNDNRITVGSCCIRKFKPLLEEVEINMKKIQKTPSCVVSKRTLEYAYKQSLISVSMYETYKRIRYKRENMEDWMLQYKKDINHEMLVQYKIQRYLA